MKKSDLKDMMIVELRDGDRYVVVGDWLYERAGYIPLTAFTDDLKHANRAYESEDIVKVYSPIKYLPTFVDLDHADQLCTLEWEREDGPDLPFNGKAVFTGTGQTNSCGYTVGNVYEFVDGKTTDDDGTRRPIVDSSVPILDVLPANAQYISERELKAFGFLKIVE